jgi:hypothetical protein
MIAWVNKLQRRGGASPVASDADEASPEQREKQRQPDKAAVWAHKTMPVKNMLTKTDAQQLDSRQDSRHSAKKARRRQGEAIQGAPEPPADHSSPARPQPAKNSQSLPPKNPAPVDPALRPKPFACATRVTANSCRSSHAWNAAECPPTRIICASRSLAALGRKVSDEFTVPLCRLHHSELHRYGDEVSW